MHLPLCNASGLHNSYVTLDYNRSTSTVCNSIITAVRQVSKALSFRIINLYNAILGSQTTSFTQFKMNCFVIVPHLLSLQSQIKHFLQTRNKRNSEAISNKNSSKNTDNNNEEIQQKTPDWQSSKTRFNIEKCEIYIIYRIIGHLNRGRCRGRNNIVCSHQLSVNKSLI